MSAALAAPDSPRSRLSHLQVYARLQQSHLARLRSTYGPLSPLASSDLDFSLPPFVLTHPSFVLSLLHSYDERVDELTAEISSHRNRRDTAEQELNQVRLENEQLESRLAVLKEQQMSVGGELSMFGVAQDSAAAGGGLDDLEGEKPDASQLEIAQLERQIRLVEKENDIMMQQTNELRRVIRDSKVAQQDSVMNLLDMDMGVGQSTIAAAEGVSAPSVSASSSANHRSRVGGVSKEKIQRALRLARERVRQVESSRRAIEETLRVKRDRVDELKTDLDACREKIRRWDELKSRAMQKRQKEIEELEESVGLQRADLEKLSMQREKLESELGEAESVCAEHQENELEALRQLKDVKEELARLRGELGLSKSRNERRETSIREIQEEIASEKDRLQKKCDALIDALRPKFEKVMRGNRAKAADADQEISRLKELLRQRTEEKKRIDEVFRSRLDQLERESTEPPKIVASLTKDLAVLSSERDAAQTKVRLLRDECLEAQRLFDQDMQRLTSRVSESKRNLLIAERDLADVASEIEETQSKSEMSQTAVQRLNEEFIARQRQFVETQARKLRELDERKADLQNIHRRTNREIRDLEERLLVLQKSAEDSGENDREILRLKFAREEQLEVNERLRLRNDSLSQRVSSMIKEIAALKAERLEEEEAISALRAQHTRTKRRLADSNSEVQSLLDRERQLLERKKEILVSIEKEKLVLNRLNVKHDETV